jgi:hypothetical protein
LKTDFFDITETNLAEFAKKLESHLLDGWAISKQNPGDVIGLYGGVYTISLYRNDETIKRIRTRVAGIQDAPKLDRATILANARAAKAAKATTKVDITTIRE